MIELVIPGTPKALKRHRHTRTGHTYDPSKQDKQDLLKIVLSQAGTPYPGSSVETSKPPVSISVIFYMPRPKSHYRTGKFSGLLRDDAPDLHTNKPDLTNLLKLVEDALEAHFYRNDSQIFNITAWKFYDENPRTEITLDFHKSDKAYERRVDDIGAEA